MTGSDAGTPQQDLYGLLAVPADATGADIIRAYRRRARALHPDSRPDDTAAASEFRALADAYQTLSDPQRRAAYDRQARLPPGGHQPARPTPPRPAPASVRMTGPVLRAGPVRVDPPARHHQPGKEVSLAELDWLLRSLLDERGGWPW
jgi:curved DNA-binding protein CbpA